MIEHARHVPLRPIPWRESEAAAAIEDIVADGLEDFDAERFWPAHPLDGGIRDGHTSFYFGATGVIWGIDYLGRVGATKARFDFRPILPRLMEANQREITWEIPRSDGSLLFGDLGTALLVMRVDPTPAIADLVYARVDANTTLPVRELMWGMPGSMIACWHMAGMTAEPRWRALFAIACSSDRRPITGFRDAVRSRRGRRHRWHKFGPCRDAGSHVLRQRHLGDAL
jgi:hypothetical protein